MVSDLVVMHAGKRYELELSDTILKSQCYKTFLPCTRNDPVLTCLASDPGRSLQIYK